MSSESPIREYFRRDQRDGISPPALAKICTFAEHIVRARGKRTQFTSVSQDLTKIRDFGDTDYLFLRDEAATAGHSLIEHEGLLAELRRIVAEAEKDERLRAIQALRYATRRKEGLVQWSFNSASVARKDLISWAQKQVQPFFRQLS